MGAFVGIDLGTTYSLVARINSDGKAEIIPNSLGQRLTPSVVDLSSDPPVVGSEAKERQMFGDPGVYAFFKRQMGDQNAIFIEHGKTYTPVDLSSMVLAYLKSCAEKYLQQPVTDAVITVPAYFKDPQRRATIRAGEMAGLNVLRIISEPTAAALAYGVRPTAQKAIYLVYDLGGGTFDVSVVEIAPDELRVIGTDGDHELGGKDWDDRLLNYLAARFEDEFGTKLIGADFNELIVMAEDRKKQLSELSAVTVPVQGSGRSGRYEVTRAKFEELSRDLLERTTVLCEQALGDMSLKWADLAGVILVGGSTRMPAVRQYVEKMSGKPPLPGTNPDEAVALGAAIQAAMDIEARSSSTLLLAGRKKSVDVISSSMGMIAVNEDGTKYVNSIIIPKNKPIPSLETRPYSLRVRSNSADSQLEVFMTQGETPDPMRCIYLGKYVFTGIPPLQSRVATIDISYQYDLNGVVEVSAKERSTGKSLNLTVEPLPPDVPDRFLRSPEEERAREHITVYLAFDLSGSMSGDPLDKAKKAANAFIEQLDFSSASAGIIEFSDRTMTMVPACQDSRAVRNGINGMTIGRTGFGNATDPFDEIHKHLSKAKGVRFGIVLADGVWSHQAKAIERARRCHRDEIDIIAIGFGGADEEFLRKISSRSDLGFFTDLNSLTETFSTIAQELTESGGHLDSQSMSRIRGRISR